MNKYQGLVIKVIDGDTYEIIINLGFNVKQSFRVRLFGIDTPEITGPRKEDGLKIKEEVEKILLNKNVILKESLKKDKFGRALAKIEIDGTDLCNLIKENCWGKEYFGGKKSFIDRKEFTLEKINHQY